MKAIAALHEIDPRQEILGKCQGLVSQVTVLGARCLVGIYERPAKTKGGVILIDKTRGEDIYQGKVGLVLALGPLAFLEDETHHWGETTPKVGNWIALRVGDTWQMILGEQQCRMVEDVDVRLILTQPDVVY